MHVWVQVHYAKSGNDWEVKVWNSNMTKRLEELERVFLFEEDCVEYVDAALKPTYEIGYIRLPFINVCDKFRKTQEGEDHWQVMMATRTEISETAFLLQCYLENLLDEGETWEQYKDCHRSDPIRYYRSENGYVFFQTEGFEFIWGGDKDKRWNKKGKVRTRKREGNPFSLSLCSFI